MHSLTVNGEPKNLEQLGVLSEVLGTLGYTGNHFAVAVNGNFVPKHQHGAFSLQGGDSLEILMPMQGG